MKIAIYSHSIAPSIDGVCRRFTALLHELDRQGHEILLFTMEQEPLDLPLNVQYVFLDFMVFPSYPDKKVARPTYRAFQTIYIELDKFKPQVIHVVADGFSQFFAWAGFSLAIPVVASFHTDIIDLLNTHNAYSFQKGLVLMKEAVDSLAMDSCATTSKSFMAKLKKQGVFCEHVIITAVDSALFNPNKHNAQLRKEMTFGDENAFLCVYIGRISSEKRIDVLIDVLAELNANEDRKAYLAIIGDGPSASKYSHLHGPENRIFCRPKFLSHPELAEIYASGDVHVSASEFETLGNTVLEAFSCGIPVVVPRTQGFLDTVDHENDGFLFQPGDSFDATQYLKKLMEDESLRQKMGQTGRAAVEKRSISNVVQDLLGWYELGIERRRTRALVPKILIYLLLWITIPTTIMAFFFYHLLVNYLLKSFIGYAGESHVKHHSHPHASPAPSPVKAKRTPSNHNKDD